MQREREMEEEYRGRLRNSGGNERKNWKHRGIWIELEYKEETRKNKCVVETEKSWRKRAQGKST